MRARALVIENRRLKALVTRGDAAARRWVGNAVLAHPKEAEEVAAGDAAVRTVPVDGIERERDGLHYSPSGQRRLGERLGQAMIELLEQESDTLCH